jgi:hypothetical protein
MLLFGGAVLGGRVLGGIGLGLLAGASLREYADLPKQDLRRKFRLAHAFGFSALLVGWILIV